MLILTRKSEESIMIGNDIIVKVLSVKGSQVHLGITAPREIPVYRHEIYEQVLKENRKAAQKKAGDKSKINSLHKHLMKMKI